MVFQDPFGSLDPNFTTYQSVAEPALIAGVRNRADRLARVRLALHRSGLDSTDTLLRSYPHGLSGGQRQRIAIARAIVMGPRILIADEPVSMLDASVRSGILNLFKQLRDELGLSIVYVSHDLPSVHYLCDRVAIMFAGRVVEAGPARDIIEWAHHPYTRELLGAVPGAETSDDSAEAVPDASETPHVDACRFANRCRRAEPDCVEAEPDLTPITDQHQVRCLHPLTAPLWKS
jgi:peptide/nickel transport system ATP-binding protein